MIDTTSFTWVVTTRLVLVCSCGGVLCVIDRTMTIAAFVVLVVVAIAAVITMVAAIHYGWWWWCIFMTNTTTTTITIWDMRLLPPILLSFIVVMVVVVITIVGTAVVVVVVASGGDDPHHRGGRGQHDAKLKERTATGTTTTYTTTGMTTECRFGLSPNDIRYCCKDTHHELYILASTCTSILRSNTDIVVRSACDRCSMLDCWHAPSASSPGKRIVVDISSVQSPDYNEKMYSEYSLPTRAFD